MARPSQEHTVRRGVPADHARLTSTLSSAFGSDPVMSWLIGPERDVAGRLSHLFAHMIRAELSHPDHLVEVADDGNAVALWHEVDRWKTPTSAVVKMLPTAVKTFGRRLPRALQTLTSIEKVHPEEPHRHLAYIGVDPEHQGTGLGGSLLATMTQECDERGLAAYLESSNPRNDPLYSRYGFVPTGVVPLPSGAPVLTTMWRAPR